MRMKTPSHPGALVRENLEELGLTIAQAAEGLGVSRQQLYNLVPGQERRHPGDGVAAGKGIWGIG